MHVMNESASQAPTPHSSATPSPPLRIALLVDSETLHSYGPSLRRLTIGLIDEVADLSLVCLEPSRLLDFIPSPPVRLITEARPDTALVSKSIAKTTRQVTIPSPMIGLTKKLFPQHQVNRLAEALADYKPTLIHAMSEELILTARRLSKQLRTPYVVSLLSSDKISSSYSGNRCGAILPCNSTLVKKIRQQQPDLARRVHLLPIGVHVTEKTACFSHNESTARLFCCSPLEHNNGLAQLIDAVKIVANHGADLELTICGQGSAERDFRRQVNKLGMASQVNFVPPIEEMISISDAYKVVLAEADIFIQPSPTPTWQPQLLEAMSVGCAVIIAKGQNSDLIIDHKTALTFPNQDEKSLANALESLLQDRQAAQTLGQNAQKHLRKHFLASQMVNRLVKAYRQALELKIMPS